MRIITILLAFTLIIAILAPAINAQEPVIRYIEYRLTGNYKCLGKGQVIGTGTYDIIINITIYPAKLLLEKQVHNLTGIAVVPNQIEEEMLVDTRYAYADIKTTGDIYIMDKVFGLLLTLGQTKYLTTGSWKPPASLYQGITAIYVPPEILEIMNGQTVHNQTASWLTRITSNTNAHIVKTNNNYEATVTASTKHFYLRTIQQYTAQGWLSQATIYIVTTININPSQLPFIYWKTIQATLIIQAQLKAEKSNIISIPENPIQIMMKYSGAIIIALIIIAIILIKRKLVPMIRNRICRQ